ncbi:MAG TPA: hypothetical protein VNU68_12730 [Verrucomicrobiae bacterium]|nr:hypothetical protein [Verrucomicrobiae bacterium]
MFSLVGNRQGKKVVRWGYVFVAAFASTIGAALVAAGLYAALTRSWNPFVLLVGPVVGLAATFLTLLASLRTPLQRLPILRSTGHLE